VRTVVTGATGFLGQHLCARLRAEGDDVIALSSRNADLTMPGTLAAAVEGTVDRIYHLAAWTQAGDFCLRHPGEQWLINQQINTNVLEWWNASHLNAMLISIGTSCSYDPSLPLSEENYLVGQPTESLFTYAMTKRMLHVGQMALSRQFGARWLTVVPSTLYGPGYHRDDRQPHFIFDLIRKIVRGSLFGEPVELWGDGHQRRELVWVDDFVEALIRLPAVTENEVVNVGMGRDHSIREFAEMIARFAEYDASAITYDTSRYVGAKSKRLEVQRLRALLPDLQPRPLDVGLSMLVKEYLAHEGSPAPALP
jgi:GDP-L-fucose synthase